MKKRNQESQYLYMLKCISCYLVVFLHFGEAGMGSLYELTRIAVPIFFIIQGRFLATNVSGKSIKECRIKNLQTEKKLICVTLIVTFVYIFFSWLFYVRCDGNSFEQWVGMKFGPIEWVKLLAFNSSRIIADPVLFFDHQWYLYAAISAIAIVILCQKYMNKGLAPLFVLPLFVRFLDQYLVHWMTDGISIGNYYIKNVYLTRNFLFTSLPFIAFGITLQDIAQKPRNDIQIKRLRIGLTVGTILGVVLTYVEYNQFGRQELYIGSTLIAMCITTMGTFCTTKIPRGMTYIGKNLSAQIFYWHPLVAASIGRIITIKMNVWVYPIFICVCSTVVAFVIIIIKGICNEKRGFIN